MAHDVNDPLSRAVIVNALWQEVRDAQLRVDEYLQYVIRNSNLDDTALLTQMHNTAVQAVKQYVPSAYREALASVLINAGMETIAKYSEDEDRGMIWRHTIAAIAPFAPQEVQKIRQLLSETADQELRWELLGAVAALNALFPDELTAELAKTSSAQDRVAHLRAVSSIPGTQHETLSELLNPDARYSNLEIGALAAGFTAATTPAQARAALPDFFNRIDSIWAVRSQEIAERIIYGIFPRTVIALENPDAELDVQRSARLWLEHGKHEPALMKIVKDCLDDSYRSARAQMFNA
ncbi:ERAP1-like C-terminal domain-containing protein [Arcanobacterium hippocoleae]